MAAMDRRTVALVVAILALLGGGLGLRACLKGDGKTEEQVLLALVDQMVAAAERNDVKQLREHLSREYSDGAGRGYREMNALLAYHYLRQGKVTVYVVDRKVEVDRSQRPLRARMRVKALLTGGPRVRKLVDLVPSSARALTFDLRLRKDDGRWMLHGATWEHIDDPRALLPEAAE